MAAVYLAGKLPAAQSPRRRPNIVYLFADQMRAHAMGCAADPNIKTPNLDRMAKDGLHLTDCISSHPVCTPYRGQLMTGQYGCKSGVMSNDHRLPDETTILPQALTDAGVADDTVLKFTSDHGDMLGAQGHRLKQRPWEESINVPFALTYPRKVKAGQKRDWLVDSVDMMPTLIGLAGGEVPEGVQGRDQSALLLGKSRAERAARFLLNTHCGAGPGSGWRGVWTKDWVYAYHAVGDWVMYDLKADPYELKNLVDDPPYTKKKTELRALTDRLRAEAGDDCELRGQDARRG